MSLNNKWHIASIPALWVPEIQAHTWIIPAEWCRENCKKKYRLAGEGVFEFEDAREHLMFMLKFGS